MLKEILNSYSFLIVGQFGSGGFAEIDDHSVVFSISVEALLKQIIADIKRPLFIFCTQLETFNNLE